MLLLLLPLSHTRLGSAQPGLPLLLLLLMMILPLLLLLFVLQSLLLHGLLLQMTMLL